VPCSGIYRPRAETHCVITASGQRDPDRISRFLDLASSDRFARRIGRPQVVSRRCDPSHSPATNQLRLAATRRRRVCEIAEAEVDRRGASAAIHTGSGLHKLAVTSMHICARIFAWAWDLLVGSAAAYPMQQVSFLFTFNPDILPTTAGGRRKGSKIWGPATYEIKYQCTPNNFIIISSRLSMFPQMCSVQVSCSFWFLFPGNDVRRIIL